MAKYKLDRGRVSTDGGETWQALETLAIADDLPEILVTEKEAYPVNGEHCCERCGTPDPVGGLTLYTVDQIAPFRVNAYDKWLCELCAGTLLGNIVHYFDQYPQASPSFARGILQALNIIRKDLTSNLVQKEEVGDGVD